MEFKKEQLKKLEKLIEEAGSEEQFLINQKAIRIEQVKTPPEITEPKFRTIVLEYEGLKNKLYETPLGDILETDIPYTYWSKAISQLRTEQGKRDFAKKSLEKIIESKDVATKEEQKKGRDDSEDIPF